LSNSRIKHHHQQFGFTQAHLSASDVLSDCNCICHLHLLAASLQILRTNGCTYKQFHQQMEEQINHWSEVDHIKSLKACELDGSDPNEVCHFTNLQVIPSWLNAVKPATWNDNDEKRWRKDILYKPGLNGVFWPEDCPRVKLLGIEWRNLWMLADVAGRE